MKNLTLENITKACCGTYHGDPSKLDKEVANVVIDSRKVEKDFLFVAIDGERVNAHKFIPDTIEKGALCVVSHEDLGETDFPYILVESTGQALLDIAKLYRDSFDVKVVGVTGSAGKTSTKEMIASILAQKYNVHKTLGNFNNEWGLPITIFEMNESHEAAILEMGVNHFGDMKNGGTIILNGDDDLLSRMGPVKGIDPVFFGISEDCEFYASDLKSAGLRGTECTLHLPSGESFRCLVPLPGIHMISNALAGAAVGYSLGLTSEEIKQGIENLPSMPGRNNIISTDKLVILDDCYNANPISTKASIDVLTMAIGRKVAILGNMGELGEGEKQLHFEIGAYAASQKIDLICGIGELAKYIIAGAKDDPVTETLWFKTKEDFLDAMKNIIREGDNVLVKASHGMQFPKLVDALKEL